MAFFHIDLNSQFILRLLKRTRACQTVAERREDSERIMLTGAMIRCNKDITLGRLFIFIYIYIYYRILKRAICTVLYQDPDSKNVLSEARIRCDLMSLDYINLL